LGPVEGFAVAWTARVRGGHVAVSPGQVVVAGGDGPGAASMDGYDRATGELLWSQAGQELDGAGCWDTGSADRMACHSRADGGRLWLMDPATGATETERLAAGEPAAEPNPLLLAEVDGGYLLDYVASGSDGGAPGRRLAFTAPDGATRWTVNLLTGVEGVALSAPWSAVDGIATGPVGGFAVDLATGANLLDGIGDCPAAQAFAGRHIWCHSTTGHDRPSRAVAAPGAVPATVHFASTLARFAWTRHPDGTVVASLGDPVAAGGYGSFDPASGGPAGDWTVAFDQAEWAVWNGAETVALHAGRTVAFLDLATGERTADIAYWGSENASASATGCVFLDGGRFLIVSGDGRGGHAELFDSRTGAVLGSFEAPVVKPPSGPVADRPSVIAVSSSPGDGPGTGVLRYLVPEPG
jgi:hypothetical protein